MCVGGSVNNVDGWNFGKLTGCMGHAVMRELPRILSMTVSAAVGKYL